MSEKPLSGRFAHRWGRRGTALGIVVAFGTALAACGSDDAPRSPATTAESSATADPANTSAAAGTVTLVTYDSFPQSHTSLNDALAEFSADTGIDVEILVGGDTGTMLAKASLTAGNPEGDVMWGIDNTVLSRAIDDGVFEPYVAAGIADGSIDVAPELLDLVPTGEATPVDYGDVCVNFDIGWYSDRDLEPPTSLDDLVDPAYADQLVVENPATSSPGLALLLATIDEYGVDGWQDYWSRLDANGVEVVDSWTQAYYERFSWAGGGPTPLVVSYGSSPPAEVIFADPPRDDAPTGVIEDTCFRQVEFAGVLAGTDAPDAARRLVDFLVSERFQSELALNLFVYPVNRAVALPEEFKQFAVVPATPRSLDPAVLDAERATWIDEWTELVLG
jgi:thiamine transport system substrate-binding protein